MVPTGICRRLVALGRDVAAADADRAAPCASLAPLRAGRDVVVGVEDLDAVGRAWMSPRVDRALAVLVDAQRLRGFGVGRLEQDFLEVQDDVGHVLDDVGDGRELVQRALDLDRRDGRALQRREEHAAQRVAERDAEAALERLAGELAVGRRQRLGVDLELLRADQVAPVARDVRGLSWSLSCSCHCDLHRSIRSPSPSNQRATRVELDDELLADRHRQVFARPAALELALERRPCRARATPERHGGRRRPGSRGCG